MGLNKTPSHLFSFKSLKGAPQTSTPPTAAAPRAAERTMIGNISVEQRLDASHVTRMGRVLTAIGTRHAMQAAAPHRAPPLAASRQIRPRTLPALTASEHQKWLAAADGALPVLSSAVREAVVLLHPDKTEEALYLPDEVPLGSAPSGAPGEEDSHPLAVLKLRSSATQVVYMVTTPEHRIRSSAKRRRWAVGRSLGVTAAQRPPLLACMEFRQPQELVEPGQSPITREQHLAQIQRELGALSSINPAIELHGLLETQDGYFLALMTNLPEEASYLLESTPDSLFDATLLEVVGEAITRLHQDVHEQGMVHGDFKLNNIMLTPQGKATLIDVASLATLDADGLADIQSTSFAPPEQLAPQGSTAHLRFGKGGDVFAVGLALFDACTEREATLLDTAALGSPHAPRLMAHASELRANKAWLMHEMTAAQSGFYTWRKGVLQGGFDANVILRDTSRYARSCHYMAKRFPELFEHWLVNLSSDDPKARTNLVPTLALIDTLSARPSHRALRAQIDANVQEIIGESMSAQLEPLLSDLLADEVATPPLSP